MNEIEAIIEHCLIFLYADDIMLLSLHYEYAMMIKNLQYDFDGILDWLTSNELYISKEKTSVLNIKTPHMKQTEKPLRYHEFDCINKDTNICKCPEVTQAQSSRYIGLIIYIIIASWCLDVSISFCLRLS